MGGCRCTYRQCTQRSDNKIHLFHYPVFDRVRCYQWLTNAQRLDFLDLKVSQLKNRVVCQHHFKPECFMNEFMDKLKFDAVPTLNGPFCEPIWHTIEQPLPIPIEDIEQNQLSFIERKANSSLKYGDFLINCEFVDLTKPDPDRDDDTITHKWSTPMTDTKPIAKRYGTSHSPPTQIVSPFVDVPSHKTVESMVEVTATPPNIETRLNSELRPKPNAASPKRSKKIKSKVVVISEEKIDKPITLKGKLRPVPPTLILSSSNKANINVGQDRKLEENKEVCNIRPMPSKQEGENYQQVTDVKEKSITPKKQLSASQKAKIDEKRNFNKKLRDMIEFCLEPKDLFAGNKLKRKVPLSKDVSKNSDLIKSVDSAMYETNAKNAVHLERSVVSKATAGSCNHAALEARLNKMENLLLSKIDQNAERITDLKNTLVPKVDKKSKSTQTNVGNEDAYKKYLYLEVSKFLTPKANNLIFEELFVNKFEKRTAKRASEGSGSASVLKQRKLRQ